MAQSDRAALFICYPVRCLEAAFEGDDYVFEFALPNFYFHLTAAYAILRRLGVSI